MGTENIDRDRFVEVLRRFDTAMFVTEARSGGLRSRPMAIAEVEDDGTMWFVTDAETPKLAEIGVHAPVNIAMQSSVSFASLTGKGEPLRNDAKARELWKEAWRVWFPDGPDETDLVLVRVRPYVGEYWDQRGSKGLRYAWEAAKAYVKGERIDSEDEEGASHGKVRM
jgi:general stress protein 26